jgi:hypothetical protein
MSQVISKTGQRYSRGPCPNSAESVGVNSNCTRSGIVAVTGMQHGSPQERKLNEVDTLKNQVAAVRQHLLKGQTKQ